MWVYVVFFVLGMIARDLYICNYIRKISSRYLDPIAFRGTSITHLRSLSLLEDDELRDVISNL